MSTNKAIEIITRLAAEGNSAAFIAGALRRARVPTISGRGSWSHVQVKRLCEKHGLAATTYDSAKIAAARATKAPIKVDTLTASKSADEPSDNDARDAAITQYAEGTGLHRWLIADAVKAYETELDELALWIESGPLLPDPTGDDEVDKLARKRAERAWCDQRDEDLELRAMIAEKDDVTAVALIFSWHCERNADAIALAQVGAKLEAARKTPERVELRKRYKARGELYRATEPKRSETLGELVIRAERAMRARRAAMAQAADDYQALNRLPVVLFDDLAKSLDRERGDGGTAWRALKAAEKTWRYRRQQATELGAATTIGALRSAKGPANDDAEVA